MEHNGVKGNVCVPSFLLGQDQRHLYVSIDLPLPKDAEIYSYTTATHFSLKFVYLDQPYALALPLLSPVDENGTREVRGRQRVFVLEKKESGLWPALLDSDTKRRYRTKFRYDFARFGMEKEPLSELERMRQNNQLFQMSSEEYAQSPWNPRNNRSKPNLEELTSLCEEFRDAQVDQEAENAEGSPESEVE